MLCELLTKYSKNIDDDILIEMALADINLMEGYESIPLINHLDLFDERIKYKLLNEEKYILRLLSSFPDSSFDVSICDFSLETLDFVIFFVVLIVLFVTIYCSFFIFII